MAPHAAESHRDKTLRHLGDMDIASVGRQYDSRKETSPSWSFGTGDRDVARLKVFLSKKHVKSRAVVNSMGPIYNVPSTVGQTVAFSFGQGEQRTNHRMKYPESSVDLTGAQVDSQRVKYKSPPGVHFGTEPRMSTKNAEVVRVHPSILVGVESPGALEYHPKEDVILKTVPAFSFGPPGNREPKNTNRVVSHPISTPRTVGPGSHKLPPGVGQQPLSARTSAPAWSFGGASEASRQAPLTSREDRSIDLLSDSPRHFSSLGKQVVSTVRTAPGAAFGRSTRDQSARTHLLITDTDRGPAGQMPRPHVRIDLPAPMRIPPTAGF